jgi:hypothetical protein
MEAGVEAFKLTNVDHFEMHHCEKLVTN